MTQNWRRTVGKTQQFCRNGFSLNQKQFLHSSSGLRFPLSDYNVFWLREPRKWDFIEFGNHGEMYPRQKVDKLGIHKLKGRYVPQNEKERPMSDDTFNSEWEVYPWAYGEPSKKVQCILQSENEIIDFEIPRWIAERINRNLRNRCIIYDLHILKPKALSMTPHQLIAESWKNFSLPNTNDNSSNMTNSTQANEISNSYYSADMINKFHTLTTKTRENHLCFLKQIKKSFLFEDVEQLVFEKWEPYTPTNIVIPIRFYGLDQWFPNPTDQWDIPTKWTRPRYVQHEWEIEFRWDGIHKIPSHLSVTVEQFCLPWKTEITLNDINIPQWLIPMKNPNDIKILSLDMERASRKRDDFNDDGTPKEKSKKPEQVRRAK